MNKEIFNKLMALVPKKLVLIREHPTIPNLVLLKYTKRAFFKKAWLQHPELKFARGHCYDRSTGNIVIRPFDKVFNLGESPSTVTEDDMVVAAVEKVNGFLGVVSFLPGYDEPVISTTGSFDSPFVQKIKDCLPPEEMQYLRSLSCVVREIYDEATVSFMFEICHPDDPHIVPELHGAHLIGTSIVNEAENAPWCSSRVNYFDSVDVAHSAIQELSDGKSKIYRPRTVWGSYLESGSDGDCMVDRTVGEFVRDMKDIEREGFMIMVQKIPGGDYDMVKWKSPHYSHNKFLGRTNNDNLLRQIWDNPTRSMVRAGDEELEVIFQKLRESVDRDTFIAADEQTRLSILRGL